MNLDKLLFELHEEASRINEAIVAIERLMQPTPSDSENGARGPVTRSRSSHRWSGSSRKVERDLHSPDRA